MSQNLTDLMNDGGVPGCVWLAGYPRSGATLVRTILAHCFGQQTAALYREDYLGEVYIDAVKLLSFPIEFADLSALLAEQKLLTVKTHERPDKARGMSTIIIIRDGRRVLDSLKAFYLERNGRDVCMPYIIRGDHPWGNWGEWHRAWAAAAPPDALWLRYEDIMADLSGTVDRLAAHFDLTPTGYEIPRFEDLNRGQPSVFRKCDVEGNGGLSVDDEEFFWRLHGGVMSMLGYHP